MRRFRDRDEHLWDVIVGRESWGANYALFVPAGDPGAGRAIRQTVLRAASFEAALIELDDADEDDLQRLLDASTIKDG